MERERELREFLLRTTSSINLSLSATQLGQFLLHLDLLLQWNNTTNLTSITDPYEVITKHFVDSLTALAAVDFPLNSTVTDVGTGGGFPGIPLKIARCDLHMVLIEPVLKKCSFLRSLVGSLKLENVSIFPCTLQQYVQQGDRHPYSDFVVLRALKFSEIADSVSKLLNPSGRLVLYQTEATESGPSDKRFNLLSETNFTLPHNHGRRVIALMSKSNAQ